MPPSGPMKLHSLDSFAGITVTRARLRSILLACLAVTAVGAMGCSHAEPTRIPSGLNSPFTGYRSATYQDPRMWICRPDLPNDACRGDLTATEIRLDGTRTIVPQHSAAAPAVDCFYVYPTVDYGWFAGNHTDFSDVMWDVAIMWDVATL